MPVTVRRATLEEILGIRHAELRPGLPLAAAHFDGDDEATTIHVGAFDDDGTAVGCASLVRRPLDGADGWQLRGMATRADRRRRGIGARVLRFVEDARGDADLLWCNARVAAVAFYAGRGWRVVSPEFDIAGVGPHRRMRKP